MDERWIDWLAGEVHVWPIDTRQCDSSSCERFSAILSDQERERAEWFRFEHLRRSFIITHGALRELLGRYLPPSSPLRPDATSASTSRRCARSPT